MTTVRLKFTIEKVEKMGGNGTFKVLAVGRTHDEIVQPSQTPDVSEEMMGQIPEPFRSMAGDSMRQMKMQQKPRIEFHITEDEYRRGDWKVGSTIDISVTESVDND